MGGSRVHLALPALRECHGVVYTGSRQRRGPMFGLLQRAGARSVRSVCCPDRSPRRGFVYELLLHGTVSPLSSSRWSVVLGALPQTSLRSPSSNRTHDCGRGTIDSECTRRKVARLDRQPIVGVGGAFGERTSSSRGTSRIHGDAGTKACIRTPAERRQTLVPPFRPPGAHIPKVEATPLWSQLVVHGMCIPPRPPQTRPNVFAPTFDTSELRVVRLALAMESSVIFPGHGRHST